MTDEELIRRMRERIAQLERHRSELYADRDALMRILSNIVVMIGGASKDRAHYPGEADIYVPDGNELDS